jgi:hypothetical protein
MDNPFTEAFASVDRAVREQQAFEGPAVNNFLHNFPDWRRLLPEEKASMDRLKTATVQKAEALCEAARAAVVPVKDSLKIEPVE